MKLTGIQFIRERGYVIQVDALPADIESGMCVSVNWQNWFIIRGVERAAIAAWQGHPGGLLLEEGPPWSKDIDCNVYVSRRFSGMKSISSDEKKGKE